MYDVWKNVLAEIEQKISGSSFQTWFKNAELVSIEKDVITIAAPNVFITNQLKARYDNLIGEAFKNNKVQAERIDYIVKSSVKRKRRGEKFRDGGSRKKSKRRGIWRILVYRRCRLRSLRRG